MGVKVVEFFYPMAEEGAGDASTTYDAGIEVLHMYILIYLLVHIITDSLGRMIEVM
jgi:hypothetical protein